MLSKSELQLTNCYKITEYFDHVILSSLFFWAHYSLTSHSVNNTFLLITQLVLRRQHVSYPRKSIIF